MKTQIIILAAGKGKRMGTDLPKALVNLDGRPMIHYLVEAVLGSEVCEKPIVVVSPDNQEIIKNELKDYNFSYAIQEQQLGSGHAVSCALKLIPLDVEKVIVLYCDHPFISSELIKNLSKISEDAVTLVTTTVSSFEGWFQCFYHWGRIIRKNDCIEKIIEFKDASPEEIGVKELNSGVMAFKASWLINNINLLDNKNNQGEFYLTSLVEMSFNDNKKVLSVNANPREALGVNSPEELALAEKIILKSL